MNPVTLEFTVDHEYVSDEVERPKDADYHYIEPYHMDFVLRVNGFELARHIDNGYDPYDYGEWDEERAESYGIAMLKRLMNDN